MTPIQRSLRGCAAALLAFASACASSPTPKELAAPPQEQSPASPPSPLSLPPTTPAAPPESLKPPEPSPPSPPPASLECPPDDRLSARERVRNAYRALDAGDEKMARNEARWALCRQPDNKDAASILRQIDEPIGSFFGPKSFEYVVQPEDTLSKISERFLGDEFLFYVLARYNEMQRPSQLKRGQVIRIPERTTTAHIETTSRQPAPPPGKPPGAAQAPPDKAAPSAAAAPVGGTYQERVTVTLSASDDSDPAPSIYYTTDGSTPSIRSNLYREPVHLDASTTLRFLARDASGNVSSLRSETYTVVKPDRFANARDSIAAEDYPKAIGQLEAALARDGADAEARDLLPAVYLLQGRSLRRQGKLTEARNVLEKAVSAQPGNRAARDELQGVETQLRAEEAYRNGVQAESAGELEKAYSAFRKALELDPNHSMAQQRLAKTKLDLVEDYTKKAMAAFRRQDLEEAIRRWDAVLGLDPSNELAKLRKAEAEDLEKRFQQRFEPGKGP